MDKVVVTVVTLVTMQNRLKELEEKARRFGSREDARAMQRLIEDIDDIIAQH